MLPLRRLAVKPAAAWMARSRYLASGGSSSGSAASEAARAREADRLWDMMVPERNWTWKHPMNFALVFVIVLLQLGINQKEAAVEIKEREEIEEIQRIRAARRQAREGSEAAAAAGVGASGGGQDAKG
eukprot:gnl/TRDRNA2_/TRDRNA2_189040_c0_seq1.p1 gnl/TRDRNA2_/TRDRNA2_189040_c0~~gnl/TRDRNA2_/TRDRNA2_189040_c0_seq1.p1  ORF type:complete len:145 (-),score=31.51 gnl/TRDRNA2_/TRDRNA2_189040_c0_seq1:26-409(-)